jgi:hypothetical protein
VSTVYLVQSDLLYAATTRYSYTILLSLRIIHNRSLGLYIRLISCVCLEAEGVFDQRSDLAGITREEV